MTMRLALAAFECMTWLALSTATPAFAQSAAQWQKQEEAAEEKADRIFTEARRHKGLLAQYVVMHQAYATDASPAFRLIFGQYLAWYQSFVGDYPAAMRSFSIHQPPQPDDALSPLAQGNYRARPALDASPSPHYSGGHGPLGRRCVETP